MRMSIKSESEINHRFNVYARKIERLSMPESRERLLKANEEERKQFLDVLKKNGEVVVEQTGIEWKMVKEA